MDEIKAGIGQWRDVKVELPIATQGEYGKPPIISDDVLAFFSGGDCQIEVCNFDHERQAWSMIGHGFREPDCEPTHWQPLPSPPAAGSGAPHICDSHCFHYCEAGSGDKPAEPLTIIDKLREALEMPRNPAPLRDSNGHLLNADGTLASDPECTHCMGPLLNVKKWAERDSITKEPMLMDFEGNAEGMSAVGSHYRASSNEHSPMKSEVKEVPQLPISPHQPLTGLIAGIHKKEEESDRESPAPKDASEGHTEHVRRCNLQSTESAAEAVEGAGLASAQERAEQWLDELGAENIDIPVPSIAIPNATMLISELMAKFAISERTAPSHPSCPKCGEPMESQFWRTSIDSRSAVKMRCVGHELSQHEFVVRSSHDLVQFFTPRAPEAAPAKRLMVGVLGEIHEYSPNCVGECTEYRGAVNFVQVVDESTAGNPSCKKCSAIMTHCGHTIYINECPADCPGWTCKSCGATTKPTEPERIVSPTDAVACCERCAKHPGSAWVLRSEIEARVAELLPLQEWSVALGLKPGEDIHAHILPALQRLSAAEAQISALTAEHGQLIEVDKWKTDQINTIVAERDAARSALDRYGRHNSDCPADPCECGLAEALESSRVRRHN